MVPESLQVELNNISLQEKAAIGKMLILTLQHGFYLADLTRLAGKYQISAAVMQSLSDDYYCVNYATGEGYFTCRFEGSQPALKFAAAFDICQQALF